MSLPSKPSSLPLEEVGALLQSTLHLQGAVRPAEPAVDRLVPEPPSCVFRLSHSDQIPPPPPAASSSSPQAMLRTPRRPPNTHRPLHGLRCRTCKPRLRRARVDSVLVRAPPYATLQDRRPLILLPGGGPSEAKDRQPGSRTSDPDSSDTDSETDTDTYQNQPNSQRLAALRCDAASRTLLGLR